MSSKMTRYRRSFMVGLPLIVATTILSGCDQASHQPSASASEQAESPSSPSAPTGTFGTISEARLNLLELAFDASSRIPEDPHRKSRAKAQSSVVEAALRLGQLSTARRFTERMSTWRQGLAFADLAIRYVESGDRAQAAVCIDRALACTRVESSAGAEGSQTWQLDRIRARVAAAKALLGDLAGAVRLQSGLVDSEWGETARLTVSRVESSQVGDRLDALEDAARTGNFDRLAGAIRIGVALHGRFYADGGVRARIETWIESKRGQMPFGEGLTALLDLSANAVAAGDLPHAAELVRRARLETVTNRLAPEDDVVLQARLASARHRAGEAPAAKEDFEKCLGTYRDLRDRIVDIQRPYVVLALAKTHQDLGEPDAALEAYRLALVEGRVNPNGCPRTEALVATCVALAAHGPEPDADYWTEVRALSTDLRAPW